MRTWKIHPWMTDQEDEALAAGFSRIRNYAGSGNGPQWLKVKWGKTYGVDKEQKDSMFRLKDTENGREYVIDKEELLHWLRWV